MRLQLQEAQAQRAQIELELVKRQAELKFLDETSSKELNAPIAEVAGAEETVPDEIEIAEIQQKYEEVKARIDALGPVNPQALEEYQEAQQRYDFLNTQRQDLLDSIRDTEKAIQEIDVETRRRFTEAMGAFSSFELVSSRNFSSAWRLTSFSSDLRALCLRFLEDWSRMAFQGHLQRSQNLAQPGLLGSQPGHGGLGLNDLLRQRGRALIQIDVIRGSKRVRSKAQPFPVRPKAPPGAVGSHATATPDGFGPPAPTGCVPPGRPVPRARRRAPPSTWKYWSATPELARGQPPGRAPHRGAAGPWSAMPLLGGRALRLGALPSPARATSSSTPRHRQPPDSRLLTFVRQLADFVLQGQKLSFS